jgi:hypothetical protein
MVTVIFSVSDRVCLTVGFQRDSRDSSVEFENNVLSLIRRVVREIIAKQVLLSKDLEELEKRWNFFFWNSSRLWNFYFVHTDSTATVLSEESQTSLSLWDYTGDTWR